MPFQGQKKQIIAITAFQPYSHYLLDETVLLPKTILDTKRYYSEVSQYRLKIISKILEKLCEKNIKKLLKLIQHTRTNMANKNFLNMFKLTNVVKSNFKKELVLFQNKYSLLQTLTFFTIIEWILKLIREMPNYISI